MVTRNRGLSGDMTMTANSSANISGTLQDHPSSAQLKEFDPFDDRADGQ
jgi:hypothetical protein